MTPEALVARPRQEQARADLGQGATVDAVSPRKLILVGDLGTYEMESLSNYCRRLYGAGLTELHLDMSGVTDCHRAGLDGLLDLVAGSSNLEISVEGAYWGQFLSLLRHAPISDVERLCDSVHELLGC